MPHFKSGGKLLKGFTLDGSFCVVYSSLSPVYGRTCASYQCPMVAVVKWLRQRIVIPSFAGSTPVSHPNFPPSPLSERVFFYRARDFGLTLFVTQTLLGSSLGCRTQKSSVWAAQFFAHNNNSQKSYPSGLGRATSESPRPYASRG